MPRSSKRTGTAAPLGFEAGLWAAADALRNNMDAAEYKHVVPGLIFRSTRVRLVPVGSIALTPDHQTRSR